MSDREESPERMDNGGSPDGDDRQSNRSDSRRGSDREGSHHSENGQSAAGRSRSRSHSNSRRYSRSRKSRSRSSDRKKYSRHSDDKRIKRSRSPMSSRRRHVGHRDNPPEGRCLGIFGLSIYTQERDLKEVFSKYGPLEDVQIVYDAQTGRSRGFSFVYFENKDDAAEAKEQCNGIDIGGRKIRVDFSITQRAHTPTPGIYMGKPTHPKFRSGGEGRSSEGRGGGSRGFRSYDRGGDRGDRRRSPSPYRRGARYSRSRSRSHSPRSRHYR